ncbi:MAG: CHAT domain-containing protein, partial [Bacteroidota bacterium]
KRELRRIHADLMNRVRKLIGALQKQANTDSTHTPKEEPTLTNRVTHPMDTPQTILFLASNPMDSGRLRLDKELREVREALEAATHRDDFLLEDLVAVRARDLGKGLLKYEPYILHFSGHGVAHMDQAGSSASGTRGPLDLDWEDEDTAPEYQGGIALEDDEGNTRLVSAEALAGLIKLFPSIKCVFLNACYSEVQAKAIISHGPCVIGMNTAIPDPTAIAFARAFYEALGEKRAIRDAFAYAKAFINLDGVIGSAIPQLICP